jgi:hypothetical protein
MPGGRVEFHLDRRFSAYRARRDTVRTRGSASLPHHIVIPAQAGIHGMRGGRVEFHLDRRFSTYPARRDNVRPRGSASLPHHGVIPALGTDTIVPSAVIPAQAGIQKLPYPR